MGSIRPLKNKLYSDENFRKSRIKLNYAIKHNFRAKINEITCMEFQKSLPLCSDFFIVLDLRLTKIGSQAWLPFAFLWGYGFSIYHLNEFHPCA